MANFEMMRQLAQQADTKIVLLVLDGLGGLPTVPSGPTELEAAHTPNLDRLATEGTLGQTIPVRPGVTPGSGPAHLSMFGYDPVHYDIGRGVLEAFGVGVQVGENDVAARGNFCTLDENGDISDRRASRIPNEIALPLVEKLQTIKVPGANIEVKHVKEYRFVVVMRGDGLVADIADTDPQQTGVPPHPARSRSEEAAHAAGLFNTWIAAAREVLTDEHPANMFTLRGFSSDPQLPKYDDVYALQAVCVAVYPMYKGVAKLVGMDVHNFAGDSPSAEFAALSSVWNDHDFFFVHIKPTDSRGEDGDFEGKRQIIESVDAALPELLDLRPDVLVVTGDHSTPARMRSHSWHPVPLLLWAPATHRPDKESTFGERECATGGLGTFPATELMPLALAHAGRLRKYGA